MNPPGQVGSLDRRAEVTPELALDRAEEEELAVGGLVELVLGTRAGVLAGGRQAGPVGDARVVQRIRRRHPGRRDTGIRARDIDERALARTQATDQSGQDV